MTVNESGIRSYEANEVEPITRLVDEQAEDEGLWFVAKTAPEAYLQQELRRLHAVIESTLDKGKSTQ